jgi:hypothetical protein
VFGNADSKTVSATKPARALALRLARIYRAKPYTTLDLYEKLIYTFAEVFDNSGSPSGSGSNEGLL